MARERRERRDIQRSPSKPWSLSLDSTLMPKILPVLVAVQLVSTKSIRPMSTPSTPSTLKKGTRWKICRWPRRSMLPKTVKVLPRRQFWDWMSMERVVARIGDTSGLRFPTHAAFTALMVRACALDYCHSSLLSLEPIHFWMIIIPSFFLCSFCRWSCSKLRLILDASS